MATSTYTAIASITLGSSAIVTFSSIPQDYRDLVLVLDVGGTISDGSGIEFNGDSNYSANYSRVVMNGNGSTANSFSNSGSSNPIANRDFGALRTNGMIILQVMDYSATDKHKTYLSRQDAAANETTALAGRWASTAAVTSMEISTDGGTALPAGTTLALYGIEA